MKILEKKYTENKINFKFQVNLDLSKRILDWNHADFKLYDYFNKTFWSKVDMFGRDKMEQELINFREKQKEAEHECIESYQVKIIRSKLYIHQKFHTTFAGHTL